MKEGEGKESPILYAYLPKLTIRQRSLPIIGTVLAHSYDEGMVVQSGALWSICNLHFAICKGMVVL